MTSCPIVIITQKFDSHVDFMIKTLRGLGHHPLRVHTQDIPRFRVSHEGSEWRAELATDRGTLLLEQVRSIWWRRPVPPQVTPDGLDAVQERFVAEETRSAVLGMWYQLENECYWVNFPLKTRLAELKLVQLRRASELGLRVPRTLVSSDADRVRSFFDTCDRRMIYKTLNNAGAGRSLLGADLTKHAEKAKEFPNAGRMIPTTQIQEEHLALLDGLHLAPGLFQELVPKRVDLRVTIIGDEIFTAEIHSQDAEKSMIDWRMGDTMTSTRMAEHRLPDEVADKAMALHRSFGLNFSTSDFVQTPQGQYVYLETNPDGQWLWVQDKVPALRMADAMAACLIRGASA